VRPAVVLVYVAISVLWGSTWLFVRLGLADLPPLLFAGVRMAIAAAILAPFALRGGAWRELVGPARGRVALVGLFQVAIPFGLMFVGQQSVPSGLSAVLFATFPVWIALLAPLLLPGERLTGVKIASALLGIGGIVVLEGPHLLAVETSGAVAVGGALILLSSVIVALANVLVRRHLMAVSPLAMTAGQSVVGSVALLAAAFVLEAGRPAAFTPRATLALLYLAVFGTALTYLGLYWLTRRVPIAAIGAIPLLDTTVAVTLGAIVLDEPVGWPLAAGGALVLAAAGLAARDSGAARPEPVEDRPTPAP
jgi:drug/metabolite transporter (DMT)-like permease